MEHADFNPLVFTCTGGMAPQCQMVVKRLAEKLSKKQNLHVSLVSGWLEMQIEFRVAANYSTLFTRYSPKEIHL